MRFQLANLATRFRHRLAWHVLCGVLFIFAAAILLDRRVAWLVAHTPHGTRHNASLLRHAVNLDLDAFLVLLPLGFFAIVRAVIARWYGMRLNGSSSALALMGAAAIVAVGVNDLLLKPLFSRYTLDDLPQHYGFRLFAGSMESSFPSGHATFTTAFFWVLMALYPQSRAMWVSILAVTFAGLIFAQWHFLSDVIAGTLLGSLAGMGAIALAARCGRRGF